CSKFKINRELEMSRVEGFYRLTETWLGPASRPKDRIDLADIDVVEQIESLHDKIELAVLANGKVLEDAQFDRGKWGSLELVAAKPQGSRRNRKSAAPV